MKATFSRYPALNFPFPFSANFLQELATALMSAHPKIQKMCEEESEDHEAVAKLLEINDSIHRTSERYKLMKKGDIEGASKIPKGTLGTSGAGVSKGPNNELSLIDLGGPDEPAMQPTHPSSSAAPAPTGNSIVQDLMSLSMDPLPATGAISLTGSNGTGSASQPNKPLLSNADITSLFNKPPQQHFSPPAQQPFFSPSPVPQQQPAAPPPKVDPFASLTQTSRTASPFQFQQATHPPPAALAAVPAQPPAQTPAQPAQASILDDEWDFASSLPSTAQPTLTLTNTLINITWDLSRSPGQDGVIEIKSRISNTSPQSISGLTFQVAVTKVSH